MVIHDGLPVHQVGKLFDVRIVHGSFFWEVEKSFLEVASAGTSAIPVG